jgi:hypothetical protein
MTLGAPARVVGNIALYTSPPNPGKVMAGTFDVTGHSQHFARYVLKDGKVIDEITQAELSDGDALPVIRLLLTVPASVAGGSGTSATAAVSLVRTATFPAAKVTALKASAAVLSTPIEAGTDRVDVDNTFGTPTQMIGYISLYSYMASPTERKIAAVYFTGWRVKRYARYTLKDGTVFDEVTGNELTQGQELPSVRSLLAQPISPADGSPAATTAAASSH